MKTINSLLTLAAVLVALGLGSGNVSAQEPPGGGGGGPRNFNFDPQQMQQMMMTFFRGQLVVTNDDEWKVIEGRLSKVMTVRMETLFGGMGALRGMRGGGGGGEGGGQMRGMRGIPGMGQPSPEAEALQK